MLKGKSLFFSALVLCDTGTLKVCSPQIGNPQKYKLEIDFFYTNYTNYLTVSLQNHGGGVKTGAEMTQRYLPPCKPTRHDGCSVKP